RHPEPADFRAEAHLGGGEPAPRADQAGPRPREAPARARGASVVIHPTAVVDRGAELAADVRVGPYSVIGPEVTVAAGAEIGAHAVLEGRVRVGARCRIGHGAVIGGGAPGPHI